ncbi:hypothetical protein AXF42_Ash003667 [Apostasia shenzhenica]|uniref:Uncharacterized protein n=1 Tax=Apostasia shenzhenica TaxID=1088818 RepID=A0A2I0AHL3_9ASPA|nr:hypothetical protein AXF42_Ash003667 [Apostasia shenzhenica]
MLVDWQEAPKAHVFNADLPGPSRWRWRWRWRWRKTGCSRSVVSGRGSSRRRLTSSTTSSAAAVVFSDA